MNPDPTAIRRVPTAVFCKIAHPVVVRLLASEPALSHLILDAEHGAFSDADMEVLCSLVALAGKESIIRVPGPDSQLVGRALDRGAHGVMVPRVSSAREAEASAQGLVLAPVGARGWDPTAAGYGYGRGIDPTVAPPRCYIQVETLGALEDAHRIVDVPGVTDLFVGPADLSRALGAEGEIFSAATVHAVEDLARRVPRDRVRLGLFVDSTARARWAYNLGYRFFAVTSDVALLLRGAREIAHSVAELGEDT